MVTLSMFETRVKFTKLTFMKFCTHLVANIDGEVLDDDFAAIVKLSSSSFQTARDLFWSEGRHLIISPSHTVAACR